VPDVPDFPEVSRATGEDECAEHPENAVEGEIFILANEINENDGNCVVRDRIKPSEITCSQTIQGFHR
jgi:hypothetical protein